MAITCRGAVMDWQLSQKSVMDRMGVLLNTSQWSDCTFRVEGENDIQVFEAHRLLLSAASPVFEAMCFGPLAEKSCIVISDMEPAVFKILLEYVYTDAVRLRSCEEAAGALYAAHKYMLPALAAACREHLAQQLRPSNALAIFDFAERMRERPLQEQCVKVICRQPLEALRAGRASGTALRALAEQQALNMTEEELWRAALRWARQQVLEEGGAGAEGDAEAEGAAVRCALEAAGLLSRVRLLALPAAAFADALRCGLFSAQEALALQAARRQREGEGAAPEDSSQPPPPPPGLCLERRPRARVPLAQFFCVRRFLKTAVTVSGRVRLLANVRATRSVVVSGVRVFTRLVPPALDARQRQHPQQQQHQVPTLPTGAPAPLKYNEDLQVSVVDASGSVLSRTRFRDAVEYNTLATVALSEAVRMRAGEEYGFLFELPSPSPAPAPEPPPSTGPVSPPGPFEYPLGFMAQTERTRDIEFRFCDHADVGATGSFVRRLDMGYVDALVYSL